VYLWHLPLFSLSYILSMFNSLNVRWRQSGRQTSNCGKTLQSLEVICTKSRRPDFPVFEKLVHLRCMITGSVILPKTTTDQRQSSRGIVEFQTTDTNF
jgi:hypothetical protein